MSSQQPWIWSVLPVLPVLLVYLVGIVATIILLLRRRSTPTILALVGFGLGFLIRLAQFGRVPLIQALAWVLGMDVDSQYINATLGCCCSLFDVIALTSLIVAIWQALSVAGTAAEPGGAEEDFAAPADSVNVYATRKLNDENDEPRKTDYATRVLNRVEEDVVEGAWEDIEGDSE
ncbi:MAG TPA: hypothetical protein ENN19_10240 [Chloroflexi bacterium]|nr:hypothetical protein [Chloroflexota bacterium]